MAKIETLTEYQKSQIIPHREYWLNYILSCKNRTDKEQAKKGIEWLYKLSGQEKPIIIFMDSPYGCQIAANFFKKHLTETQKDNIGANIKDNIGANIKDSIWDNIGNNIRANIGHNIWTNIRANIRANIGDNIGANIRDNIRANIWDNIRANIRDNIGANIKANIGANIRANIRDNIRANIRDNNAEYYQTSYYGNVGDYGWVAWIDYFLQMDLIKTDKKEDFESFKNLLLSGVFEMIQFKGLCIVSDMPTSLIRNEAGLLHSVNGYSVEFKDGFSQHYINGRYLPANLFDAIKNKSLTPEVFFKEQNEDIKAASIAMMQELYGEEYVFNFFRQNMEETDTYIDKKEDRYLVGTTKGMNIGVYTLFKGEISGENVAYVRCYCPSSDRMFFLGVDPKHNNAKDAIASLYRVPKRLKNHIKYIQRQGERFSTVFNEEGTSLLKQNKLSKSEIADTTTISGDQYFSLIKFEY